jgi:predicted flap endonuclease-1-like 5' DNA nuclease
MPITKLIRTMLGLGSSDSSKEDSAETTNVAVEHEPEPEEETEPDAETEAAVKGTDEAESDDELDGTDTTTDDAVAAGTDAAASTGSITEEPPGEDGAAEPAEAGTDVSNHSGTDTPAAEPAEAAGPVPDEPEGGSVPVENVSGIGPAYANRLNEAGIDSVNDLLDADAEELSEETDLSPKRIQGWQENAADI